MRIFIAILLLLPITLAQAQFKLGDFHLLGTIDRVSLGQLPGYTAIGVRGELMFGKVFGTEFGFSGSRDNFHMGLGILSPLALLLASIDNNDNDGGGSGMGGLVLFLACAASFIEHTNYHIRITDSFEVVPFVSLGRFRYMYDRTDPAYNTDQFLSWSVGTKLSLLSKENLVVNFSAERTQLYYTGRPAGWQAGLHIGYVFKSKSDEE